MTEPLQTISRNGLTVFCFPHLAGCEGLRHGVFSRLGGVSAAPFDGLNVSVSTGDDPAAVLRNREAISSWFGGRRLFFLNQIHGTDVVVLKKGEVLPDDLSQPDADALVTDRTDIMLGIKLADCQGVLLYDPDRPVVADIHSGWRGSVANIIGKTVNVMTKEFGCAPANILAGISPSLGPCCAEFVNYKQEVPEDLWGFQDENHYFDFWKISRQQLVQAGVLDANIITAGICTSCRTDLFFSYRKEKRTGRFTTVIGLEEVGGDN